ncbi:MAG: hypothetical protein GF353_12105 [Candidatus Lokiarchaeota archaeon]|nr:hypothetical protein [Candidatus Lokiarchaeota archaeon]
MSSKNAKNKKSIKSMIFDLHLHLEGRSPCSILSQNQLIDKISPKLDGICITDHNIIKPIKKFYMFNIKVFFGVEIWSELGDILAYGINILPSKNSNAKQIIDFVHKHNGVAIAAHPFSNRHVAFGDKVYEYDFDAIEINGAISNNANKLAEQAAKNMEIPLIGGSDAHSVNQLNSIGTKFKIKIRRIEDIVKAIKLGKCEVIGINKKDTH